MTTSPPTASPRSTTPRAPSAVFLNRFYWPDVAATGQMLADLAEDLAAAGWQVRVVTSQSRYASDGPPPAAHEVHQGVTIRRVRSTSSSKGSLVGRLLDYASYLAGAFTAALGGPRPDLIVAMTDPPVLAALAVIAARMRGAKSVYWVQDVYPDIAAALGVVPRTSLAYRVSAFIARWAHRRSDAVIVQGPRMAQVLAAAGADPARTRVLANWADARAIQPVAAESNPFLDEHQLRGQFVVLYSGNAGRGHTFDAVLGAMERLRGDDGITFVFIGGGPQFPYLQDETKRRNLTRVRFMGYLPRERLSESLSAAGAALVTESPSVAGLLLPSKTFGILAAARPLLFVGDTTSDVAAVLRAADAGRIIAPTDADALAAAIRALRDDPAECARLGANGRRAALAVHDRRVATKAWAEVVRTILDV